MKKLKTLTALLLIGMVGLAQVQSSAGLKLVATGPLKLVFNDAALINHGSFSPGNSTVIFQGNASSLIGGSSAVNFYNLVLDKDVSLENDLNISGKLSLAKGNLHLNSSTLDLGYTGSIDGERNEARITGNSGGIVKAYALLNAPAAANPGNIGVEISSSSSLGETVIIRGHSAQFTADGQPVIARYYDIKPQHNSNLRATLKFYYLDAELGNGQEERLAIFSSKNKQGRWIEAGKDKSDLSTNWIVKNDLEQLNRFTLAAAAGKALAEKNGKTSVSLFPNPTPGQFTVSLNSSEDKRAALNLYDQLGRLLERKQIQFRAGVNNITWNIARYANGTYYLSFENIDLKPVKIVKE